MVGAKENVKEFNNRPKKGNSSGGSSAGSNRSKADYGKIKKGYSGGSRKSSDDDF